MLAINPDFKVYGNHWFSVQAGRARSPARQVPHAGLIDIARAHEVLSAGSPKATGTTLVERNAG